jgi:thiol-disulfide isomerase/thioredoxin
MRMMKSTHAFGCAALLLIVPVVSAPAAERLPVRKRESVQKFTVRLVDSDHKPLAGAHVGSYTTLRAKFLKPEIADSSGLMYYLHAVADQDGLACVEAKGDDRLLDYRGRIGLVARQAARHLIAFTLLDEGRLKSAAPIEIVLVPECRVIGRLVCPELAKRGRKIGFTSVSLSIDKIEFMDSRSESDGDFQFFAPPGRYDLFAWGEYAPYPKVMQTLTVPESKREVELNLTVGVKNFALLMGQPAPELRDIAAWKNSPPLKLADLKGKCVVLEFWGHWCGPCVAHMPELMALYDRYKEQGLVVIAIHVEATDQGIDTVAKLDAKLAGVRKRRWHGRDLPFPVAIARPRMPERSMVEKDYGASLWPYMILIDRRGNVVDFVDQTVSLSLLEKALAEKPNSASAK